MFTGIIEDIGKVRSVNQKGNIRSLEIISEKISPQLKEGDSVSVNGVCLTVTTCSRNGFKMDVIEETLNKSTLKELKSGGLVNLEPAVQISGRFNGHFVLGHIDGTGKLTYVQRNGENFEIVIKCGDDLMKYIVTKGSVCIDGISLTVAEIFHDSFKLSIIPFTYDNTILKFKKAGQLVNIETDIIGKYVYKFSKFSDNNDLNLELLKKYGF